MKGDFSRLTFDKNKHYTSVRVQQGRLQLDSDSNEQADIQAHLYRTQVVDLIGAESGVPSSDNDTGKPYQDSFKISVTPDRDDLAIAPGHLYVNGTLCELEATPIKFTNTASPEEIQLDTLIVDGRKFVADQWVEIVENQQLIQIKEINAQTLELLLKSSVNQSGRLRHIVTYKTQPDYPNSEHNKNGLHFVYLDVWQRHITTVEDPELREVALNIPDTTTRTKTVWQLKLQALNRTFIQQDLKTNETEKNNLLEKLKQLSIKEVDQAFNTFWDSIQVDNKQDTWRQNFFPERSLQKFHESLENITRSHQEELQSYFQSITTIENAKKTLQTDFDDFLQPATLEPTAKTEKVNNFNQELNKITTPDQKSVQELLAEVTIPELDKLLETIIKIDKSKEQLSDKINNLLEQIVAPEQQPSQDSFNNILENIPGTDTNKKQNLIDRFGNLLVIATTLEQNKQSLRETFDKLLANLIAAKPILQKIVAYQKDEVNPDNLNDPDWNGLIKKIWQEFLQSNKERQANMNACAKLCAAAGSATSNSRGYQRLENQLYRVEIHEPGEVKKAKFKWSRDNGSIVSTIEDSKNIQKGIITIRKSAQDAWANSQTGQWIEILDEERELKSLPGALAPLNRVVDTKIEFDANRVAGKIPDQPTKVRRWDQMKKEAAILTLTEWIELEAGIKVKFDDKSEYKTGDYWLIPARSATNDIEWPNDQAKEKRQPLPRSALGIYHDYCLLAAVQIEEGKFIPVGDNDNPQSLKSYRYIFPSLVNTFDRNGGVINGDLTVLGKVGIGVEEALARLQTQATGFIKAKDKNITKIEDTKITLNNVTGLNPGDLLKVDNKKAVITTVNVTDKSLITDPALSLTLNPGETKEFEYQQPITRFTDEQGEDKLIILANGNTGIGTSTPQHELEVKGVIKTEELITNKLNLPNEVAAGIFRATTFQIAQNPTSPTPAIYGLISIQDNPKRVEFVPNQANIFAFINNSQVGIGASNLNSKFGVLGNVAIGDNNYLQSNTTPAEGLIVKGSVGIGTQAPKNKLDVIGGVAIGNNFAGVQESPDNGLIVSGKVGIGVGTFTSVSDVQLYVKGGVLRISRDVIGSTERYVEIGLKSDAGEQICDFETNCSEYKFDNKLRSPAFIGDGSGLTGVVKTTENNTFTGDLTANQNVLLATENQTRKVGIGISDSSNVQAKLHVAGSIKADNDIICDRLIVNSDPPPDNPPNDAQLYVGGKLYVKGQLYVTDVISTDTINTTNQTVKVLRSGDVIGNTFKQISSRTLKEEIGDLTSKEAEELLQTLQPVKFIYTGDEAKSLHAGFIAEDTPDLLTSTDKQAVKLLDIVAVLTKSVKDQQAKAEELTEVIQNQNHQIETLQARLKELEERDLNTQQYSVLFANTVEEEIRRSPNTSRRNELTFYQKIKRLLRRLWHVI